MDRTTTVLAVAGVYLAVNLAVGLWPRRGSSRTTLGFVAGDRTLGPLVMYFITGATIFSAFVFLGGPGWAYHRGAAAFYIVAYGVLGFVPFYFLGPRAARLGRRHGFVTQAEMVAHRFRMPALAGAMALVSLIAFVPYLALQMKGAGHVLEAMSEGAIPKAVGAAVVYAVVGTYVLKSGVLGVGWTNVFQGLFMMAAAWALGLYVPHALYGGLEPMYAEIAQRRPELLLPPGLKDGQPWAWSEFSSAVLVSTIGFSCWPHLFMKAFTARDERTLQRTVVLYPTFMVFLVPLLTLGFAAVLRGDAPREIDQVLPHLLLSLDLPAVLVGLFCAGALAASMSSGDAIAHAAASIAVRDGLVTACGRRLGGAAERRAIRWVLVAVLAGSYAWAMLSEATLVRMLLYAYGPITQLAPALVATFYWRRATGEGALTGMLLGIAVTLAFELRPDLRPHAVHPGLYGLACNIAALVVVSLLTRPRVDPREGGAVLVGPVEGLQRST